MKTKSIEKIYDDFVDSNFISYDEQQVLVLKQINSVWNEINSINIFKNKSNGIYIYGSVGIGKTFIINLFINNIKKSCKFHFNHFMINLHAFVNNAKDKNALEIYIKKLAKEYKIIFIDELHIFNIVDALLIKKIFILFKKYKIFIITSSNFKPSDLYKNGLQRNDFTPFISFVENKFEVINLKNIKDYRRQMLNQSKTYFTPINTDTTSEFIRLFDRFVKPNEIHIRRVQTKSRNIRFDKCSSNIAYLTFEELCDKNLGHEDYTNIAKAFKLIFIKKVPYFNEKNSDQCRRFISLIDMLYDQKCSVVILAEKPINKLCGISKLSKEFDRTASRLYEMTIINSKNK